MKQDTVLNGALIVIAACTAILTGAAVARVRDNRASPHPAPLVTIERGWRAYDTEGARIGPTTAPVQIVEFADFECPFCAREASVIEAVLARHPDQVALIFRHFPLDQIHPYAHAAALAGICADQAGWFPAFYRTVFANQDSLSGHSWGWFAQRAGRRDTTALHACMTVPATARVLARDEEAGRAVQVSGTPTLFVNQFRINGAVPVTTLDSLVELALGSR